MILAIDIFYKDDLYKTCGVLFENFESKEPIKILTLKSNKPASEYIPGQFYKRELPCIIEFLKYYKLHPEYIIIDGYINLLFDDGIIRPGLGEHLIDILKFMNGFERTKIIGVAKSKFANNCKISHSVIRGKSKNPIFVQGIDGEIIKNMYGSYRIPEMLKIMDFYTKHDGEDEICNFV